MHVYVCVYFCVSSSVCVCVCVCGVRNLPKNRAYLKMINWMIYKKTSVLHKYHLTLYINFPSFIGYCMCVWAWVCLCPCAEVWGLNMLSKTLIKAGHTLVSLCLGSWTKEDHCISYTSQLSQFNVFHVHFRDIASPKMRWRAIEGITRCGPLTSTHITHVRPKFSSNPNTQARRLIVY